MSTKNRSSYPPLPEGAQVDFLAPDLALLSFPLHDPKLPDSLTVAERDVAVRVYRGATNGEIASARGVSAKTVARQLESIYRKLGVASRRELVLRLLAEQRTVPPVPKSKEANERARAARPSSATRGRAP